LAGWNAVVFCVRYASSKLHHIACGFPCIASWQPIVHTRDHDHRIVLGSSHGVVPCSARNGTTCGKRGRFHSPRNECEALVFPGQKRQRQGRRFFSKVSLGRGEFVLKQALPSARVQPIARQELADVTTSRISPTNVIYNCRRLHHSCKRACGWRFASFGGGCRVRGRPVCTDTSGAVIVRQLWYIKWTRCDAPPGADGIWPGGRSCLWCRRFRFQPAVWVAASVSLPIPPAPAAGGSNP
jgi:hypothetical protein